VQPDAKSCWDAHIEGTPPQLALLLNIEPLLSLLPGGLAVDRVEVSSERVTLHARSSDLAAPCPVCALPSGRIHGRYTRHVADLPLMGRVVSLSLQIRRFRCSQTGCPRRIFAERLPAAAPFRKRRTARLAEVQRSLALGAGGELGSRLASQLAMPVSGDTLLRLIRAVPVEPAPPARVIGIDDWAWRRGKHYGTLIVDLERGNQPIDLLPDRQAETVAAWLKAHPGVEIVARDRAGAFADGVRTGAPEAVQVADRFHLLLNLGNAVGTALNRHHRDIRAAAKAVTALQPLTSGILEPALPALPPQPLTRSQQRSLDKQAARQARFDEAVALHAKGWSKSRIARTLGLDRGTVHVWLKAGRLPSWQQPSGDSTVEVHGDYLRRRWDEGCHNGVRLWREIRERGFAGGASTVRDWLRRLRAANPQPAGSMPAWKTPSGRRAAWLVVADPDEIDGPERKFVDALMAGSAELADLIALAREFRTMVREQQADRLDHWLTGAENTALAGFVGGLKRDLAAVRAGLSLPWSTGPVEGQICRLKTIKRTMCGRAGFDLLRHRVLEAA
jgi:transposase